MIELEHHQSPFQFIDGGERAKRARDRPRGAAQDGFGIGRRGGAAGVGQQPLVARRFHVPPERPQRQMGDRIEPQQGGDDQRGGARPNVPAAVMQLLMPQREPLLVGGEALLEIGRDEDQRVQQPGSRRAIHRRGRDDIVAHRVRRPGAPRGEGITDKPMMAPAMHGEHRQRPTDP